MAVSETTEPTKAWRRLPRAEREERMLDAAEEVFSAGPYAVGSMDEIAARSGITKPMLYKYFGSKEGLYEACVERVQTRLFAAIDTAARAVPPGPQQIDVFVERYVAMLAETRQTWWLLYSDASAATVSAMRRRNADGVAALLRDTFEALGLAVEGWTVDLVARSLAGAGEEIGRWWTENPDVAIEDVTARFRTIARGAIFGTTAEWGSQAG